MGRAQEREDVVAPEIAASPDADIFLISTRSEENVRVSMGRWAWLWGLLGLLITCVPLIMVVAEKAHKFPEVLLPWVGLPPVVFAIAWVVGWVWMVFNSIVGLRQRVRRGWSLIDVQLKRRHDLIPRLTAVLDGLSSHEKEVQTAVAELRTQSTATAPGRAGHDPVGVAGSLRMVVEKYPELTAQEGFSDLHAELVQTEQRVALARAYYNDIATEFATRLEVIPDRWVATLIRMKPEPLFNAVAFERAAVTVDFSA